jgi:hypothetical protein
MRVSSFPLWIVFCAGIAPAQSSGTFSATGSITEVRSEHATTLMSDGRVLITGGYGTQGEGLASAGIYDPSTGTFTAAGRMAARRRMHSSVLLRPSSF